MQRLLLLPLPLHYTTIEFSRRCGARLKCLPPPCNVLSNRPVKRLLMQIDGKPAGTRLLQQSLKPRWRSTTITQSLRFREATQLRLTSPRPPPPSLKLSSQHELHPSKQFAS